MWEPLLSVLLLASLVIGGGALGDSCKSCVDYLPTLLGPGVDLDSQLEKLCNGDELGVPVDFAGGVAHICEVMPILQVSHHHPISHLS